MLGEGSEDPGDAHSPEPGPSVRPMPQDSGGRAGAREEEGARGAAVHIPVGSGQYCGVSGPRLNGGNHDYCGAFSVQES